MHINAATITKLNQRVTEVRESSRYSAV